MTYYEQLNEEQKQAVDAFCERNGITLQEKIEQIASTYFNAVKEVLVNAVLVGAVAGYTARQFIELTRDELIQNMLNDALELARSYEQNLMKVSYNTRSSHLCATAQNKIYYLLYPEDPAVGLLDDYICSRKGDNKPENYYKTGRSLFHKNCLHQLYAYFPGESDPVVEPELSEKELLANEALAQELNYINREAKKYYERKEIARKTDNPSYEKNKDLWKKWTGKRNEFIKKHGDSW